LKKKKKKKRRRKENWARKGTRNTRTGEDAFPRKEKEKKKNKKEKKVVAKQTG